MRRFIIAAAVVSMSVLVGALAIRADRSGRPAPPSVAAWQTAADAVVAELRPGDVVRVVPSGWAEAAAPVAARVGPALDRTLPPDPLVVARGRRLLVLTAGAPPALGVPPAWLAAGPVTELDGGMRLLRFDVVGSPVTVDLLADIGAATVERTGHGGQRRVCRADGQRHRCGGRPWEDVEVRVEDAGGSLRRCLRLHPYPDGGSVSVTFPNVAIDALLLVRAGLLSDAARHERSGPVHLTVRVGGEPAMRATVAGDSWDFGAAHLDTARWRGRRVAVGFEVDAPRERYRDVCLDAYVTGSAVATPDARLLPAERILDAAPAAR